MFKHLMKLIWNKKKQNFLLFSEIFISFLVIFGVFTFAVYAYKNYEKPMGFEYENVWVISYNNTLQTTNSDSLTRFYQTLKQNIKSFPQVKEATYTNGNTPFGNSISISGEYYNKRLISTNNFMVDVDYKPTLGFEIAEGRWYNSSDLPQNKVLVINQAFEREVFGSASGIGKYLTDDKGNNRTKIIGVVKDFKFKNEYQAIAPSIYNRYDTSAFRWMGQMMVKVTPNADAAFEGRLYKMVSNTLKNSNIEIQHLPNRLKSANNFMLVPLIILSIVATFLIINVALGLFGVLWYNINRRRGEIGLRRAIGADGNSVSGQLVLEALILATFSLIVGAFFAVQFPLLSVFDLPASVYLTALILAVLFIYMLVLICSLYPGRQAAAIYPAVALHEE